MVIICRESGVEEYKMAVCVLEPEVRDLEFTAEFHESLHWEAEGLSRSLEMDGPWWRRRPELLQRRRQDFLLLSLVYSISVTSLLADAAHNPGGSSLFSKSVIHTLGCA